MLDKFLDFIAGFFSNKVLPHLVWEGDVIDLGNVTIGSGGYSQFNVNVPSGATTIGYRIRWSTNTSTFSILPYYENPAVQFVIGTPGAKITKLKVIPVYFGGGYRKDWNFNDFGIPQRFRKAVGLC